MYGLIESVMRVNEVGRECKQVGYLRHTQVVVGNPEYLLCLHSAALCLSESVVLLTDPF